MNDVVPTPPAWRRQVEQGTALAIGLGNAATASALPPDSSAGAVADTVLGLAVDGQRRALDAAETVLAVGGAVARAGLRIGPVRALAARASRSALPARAHGRAVREISDRLTRDALPRYAAKATGIVVDVVPIDEVVAGVDVAALLDRIDVGALVDRVDVTRIIDRVDIRALIARVDVQEIIDRVDIEALLDRIDIGAVVDRVDVGKIIDRVDVQEIIDRVDVGTILDRVDVQAIIERVDIDSVVGRVDVETLIDRVDVDSLVERTDLGRIVAQSTGGVASGAVDLVRRQGVGLDSFVARWAGRLRPRALADAPKGPPLLVGEES